MTRSFLSSSAFFFALVFFACLAIAIIELKYVQAIIDVVLIYGIIIVATSTARLQSADA